MDGPIGYEFEVSDATQRLKQGATAGMVVKTLERQGIPKHRGTEIVEAAQVRVRRKKRLQSWGTAAAGLLLTLVGPALFLLLLANGWLAVKPAVIVSLFGAMVCMYGIVNALTT